MCQLLCGMQITIKREMKELQGEVASNTDGEVIIVFDLRADSALLTKRTARELVNRFQKLRKKAGLLATDTVELFYAPHVVTGASTPPPLAPISSWRITQIVRSRR